MAWHADLQPPGHAHHAVLGMGMMVHGTGCVSAAASIAFAAMGNAQWLWVQQPPEAPSQRQDMLRIMGVRG